MEGAMVTVTFITSMASLSKRVLELKGGSCTRCRDGVGGEEAVDDDDEAIKVRTKNSAASDRLTIFYTTICRELFIGSDIFEMVCEGLRAADPRVTVTSSRFPHL